MRSASRALFSPDLVNHEINTKIREGDWFTNSLAPGAEGHGVLATETQFSRRMQRDIFVEQTEALH